MFVREGFWIGPLFIYYYALLIMAGALGATYLASHLAKLRGENPETPWDMMPWLLIGGIIGARLWHILTPPASMVEQGITTMYYLTHPLDAINIRRGGSGNSRCSDGRGGRLMVLRAEKEIEHVDVDGFGCPWTCTGSGSRQVG